MSMLYYKDTMPNWGDRKQNEKEKIMKSTVNFVLRNKLAIWIMTIIIAGAGIYSGMKMKMETMPDISIPIISVSTTYPGATPEQVANDVSIPVENAVESLKGVKTVTSTSYQNMSSLQIEYNYGADMKEAQESVKEVIEKLELPETTTKPVVDRVSINAFPVIALSVSNKDQSIAELTDTVENNIIGDIQGIDGVGSATATGQQVDKVKLTYNQAKMAKLGLTEDAVAQVIKASDLKMPLGIFNFEKSQESVVVDGKATTIKELENVEIPTVNPDPEKAAAAIAAGEPLSVKLKDIASIKKVGEVESISRTNGQDAIAIQVVKGQDANTVDVVNAVKDKVKSYEDRYDVKIDVTLDQGEPIEASVKTMVDKALFGALFAVIIILIFLRNFRSTIISIVSIPMSLLMGVIVLKQMDITLNMMTLGAMTVAIGRVIDDSIVVVENIYRRMHLPDEKLKGKALIREATLEMFRPIMSSTLVTVAVFVPLGLVSGMVGELFLPFALTIAFALVGSLIIAVTIVPVLSHTLFKKELNGQKPVKKQVEEHGKMAIGYTRILKWVLNHKWITSLITLAALIGSLALTPLVGFSFMPDDEQKLMYVTYTPKAGQTDADVAKDVKKVEKLFMDRKDVKMTQLSTGGANPMMGGSGNGSLMYVTFDDDVKNFDSIKDKVLNQIEGFKQAGEWKSQDFTMTSNSELSYSVYGNSEKEISGTVKDIEKIMNERKDMKNVTSSLTETYEEHTLKIDGDKVSALGLSTAQIGQAINPNKQATVLTTVKKGDKDIDVEVQSSVKAPDNFKDVLKEKIKTPTGQEVALSELVKVENGTTANSVSRSEGKVFATVKGKITDKDISKASSAVQKKIDKLETPKSIDISSGGATEDMADAFSQLGLAMVVAIAIVYLILVITFGEGLAPFAILFSLPLTVIGSIVALLIAREPIDVSTMIGLLMLIGIVVTNAIVLVDRIIHKEHEGMPMREAILEAGATRLRPILMTAIATIGALIPLAIGAESSGLISKGLGVTVIGGLISSTLLTLVIVPLMYEALSKLLKKKRNKTVE